VPLTGPHDLSWFAYPHAGSIEFLRRTGVASHTETVLALSCLLDLAMGIVSLACASSLLWWSQFLLVAVYSIVIAIFLQEFLLQLGRPPDGRGATRCAHELLLIVGTFTAISKRALSILRYLARWRI
jgi:membrane protein implicated in regulation of membrane protease activity